MKKTRLSIFMSHPIQYQISLIRNIASEKEIDLRDNLENMDEIEDLVIDNQPKIDEIKEISSTSPKSLATLIENWLAEDVSDEEVNEEEKTLVEELS